MQGKRVIVAGVGTMGSSTCYHLAKRGAQVIGLDQHSIPNEMGSHAGQSRAFRQAYDEGDDYVPMLKRSRELWLQLNKEAGKQIFFETGGLYLNPPEADNKEE
jgi:sarcosine oxidase